MEKRFLVFFVVLLIFASCAGEKNERASLEFLALELTPPVPPELAVSAVKPDLPLPKPGEGEDLILRAYRNPVFREDTLAFFGDLTGSAGLADAILGSASANNIPPALAFSLCEAESAYNPQAKNLNTNKTVDRGLFQLNSSSFPKLAEEDFFDPLTNTKYGLAHLRWCLDTAGTEVAALAMYNAGIARVRSAGTPKSTLDYVSRILKRQRALEEDFAALYERLEQAKIAEAEEAAEESEKTYFRLSMLTPLGRK